ncbi:YcgL domain-containing protein [Zymobacter palmae]|uniref:YcgL domain-containing protein ZBT109_0632 n=1 Tax=Zymobacter palmae TaxID=33074 RepID=A0A348HCQ8_9GAMM|nr:YcgL domain-containing protein [Zymobacter palmae]BBG29410.1 uncharacterized protein conserved in bacteria [Zymobacter palmae]
MQRCLCQVYRSKRHDGMYLFVEKAEGLARVPEALLAEFGVPEPSIVFVLTPERSMVRVDAMTVLADIEAKGFHLQLPPPKDGSVQGLNAYSAPTEGRY